MEMPEEVARDVTSRLRRAQGQIGGILAMIEEGRDCEDIVTQLAAAAKALDRAGFRVVVSGLQLCHDAQARGEEPAIDQVRLEKLFMSLT